jgi:hypothetical protein
MNFIEIILPIGIEILIKSLRMVASNTSTTVDDQIVDIIEANKAELQRELLKLIKG